MADILLIEDDAELRIIIGHFLEKHNHAAEMVDSLESARVLFKDSHFDLILSDVNLGEESGIDYIKDVRDSGFEGGIIMMTGYATVDDAVRAMRLGADDYLAKPIRMQELLIITERVLKQRSESRQLRLYKRVEHAKKQSLQPLGESKAWIDSISMANRLAQIPVGNRTQDSGNVPGGALTTILITGETGSGKGVLARYIHDSSPEHDRPFVHVNCTALPASLIESELFGHEKGAFTDAKSTREGLFEMADGGTIFLDEIGDLDLPLQAKLLSVIENGQIRKVGATKEKAVRMRVLAATNKDLRTMVTDGTFREDLLFRINSFPITIPNLRSRGDDVVLIAVGILDHLRKEYGLEPATFSKDAKAAMIAHAWPGNVRELFNAVQRAAMLAPSALISSDDLAIHSDTFQSTAALASNTIGFRFNFDSGAHTVQEVERELMVQALDQTNGNITQAAKLISMQRSSFRFRVEKYKITNSNQKVSGI
ncbi:MAG: sigma-54-dependent Fis family transcriptional regulator [Phycisphaerales bacterium]|nr:sigma-54-dependent Fis family transcriptional regulator [Phycisphaerales bacterium]